MSARRGAGRGELPALTAIRDSWNLQKRLGEDAPP